jgi:hypothetical protein
MSQLKYDVMLYRIPKNLALFLAFLLSFYQKDQHCIACISGQFVTVNVWDDEL